MLCHPALPVGLYRFATKPRPSLVPRCCRVLSLRVTIPCPCALRLPARGSLPRRTGRRCRVSSGRYRPVPSPTVRLYVQGAFAAYPQSLRSLRYSTTPGTRRTRGTMPGLPRPEPTRRACQPRSPLGLEIEKGCRSLRSLRFTPFFPLPSPHHQACRVAVGACLAFVA